MNFLHVLLDKCSIPIENLLNSRLDHYAIYGIVLGILFLLLFGLTLGLKKEKFLLPAFFASILLTSALVYVREFSPWSHYLQRTPKTKVPSIELILPKRGEVKTSGEGTLAIPREKAHQDLQKKPVPPPPPPKKATPSPAPVKTIPPPPPKKETPAQKKSAPPPAVKKASPTKSPAQTAPAPQPKKETPAQKKAAPPPATKKASPAKPPAQTTPAPQPKKETPPSQDSETPSPPPTQ